MPASDKANSKKMKSKTYDKQLRKLQLELCRLQDWVDAYDRGHVKVTGDAAVVKLIGNVIERQLARAR